jgi:hypothetical protein
MKPIRCSKLSSLAEWSWIVSLFMRTFMDSWRASSA